MTFVITAEGRQAEAQKRRKRNRDHGEVPMGHAPEARGMFPHQAEAEAAQRERDAIADDIERDRAEGGDGCGGEPEGSRKAIADRGIHPGPGHPLTPGEISPQDLDRPYLTAGHAAESPGNAGYASPARHVDFSGSRGMLMPISPAAPMGPGGGR